MTAITERVSRYPDDQKRFAGDTDEHQMTVLHDDGLYRHLRFKAPGTFMYWFDLVTWPGCLAINGDMGSFVFARLEDMFDFFASGPDINPGYWEGKLQAHSGVKAYSDELFERLVNEHAADEAAEIESETIRERFLAAVKDEVIDDWDTGHEDGARQVLDSFRFRVSPASPDEDAVDIRFSDTWEWDLKEYTAQFLWCCFAIRWGISQFRAAVHP